MVLLQWDLIPFCFFKPVFHCGLPVFGVVKCGVWSGQKIDYEPLILDLNPFFEWTSPDASQGHLCWKGFLGCFWWSHFSRMYEWWRQAKEPVTWRILSSVLASKFRCIGTKDFRQPKRSLMENGYAPIERREKDTKEFLTNVSCCVWIPLVAVPNQPTVCGLVFNVCAQFFAHVFSSWKALISLLELSYQSK